MCVTNRDYTRGEKPSDIKVQHSLGVDCGDGLAAHRSGAGDVLDHGSVLGTHADLPKGERLDLAHSLGFGVLLYKINMGENYICMWTTA